MTVPVCHNGSPAARVPWRLGPPLRQRIPYTDIVREVSATHGLSDALLVDKLYPRLHAVARQHLMFELWAMGHSLPWIGRKMNNRHHTTILSGIRRHMDRNGITQ